jgi:hypothetical protein
MNEKIKAVEIKDDFSLEFDKTLRQLKETYPRVSRVKKDDNLSDNVFQITIYTILLNMLKQIQIDSTLLSISEFHSKYVPNLPILYRDDFTCDEFKEIIESSYLKDRDKEIAYKFFVEKKSINDIYAEMVEIEDKKTISKNLEPINEALLYKACRYNKKNN